MPKIYLKWYKNRGRGDGSLRFDDEYLKLLKPEEFEIELSEIVTRDDKNIRIVTNSTYSTLSLANRETLTKIAVKLPKLELTKFYGNILNWQVFWDQFNSSIHLNNNISDIDKFSSLLSFLQDSVKSLILGPTPSSANYLHLIDLLQERYANPPVLISAYMQRFVTIPNFKSDKDIRVLRSFYDEVKTSVRNLNVEISTYCSLLVPLLIEKLPNHLRIRLLEFGIGNLNEMLDFLKLEVEAKQKSAAIGTSGTFSNQKYSQSYEKFTTAALNKSTHKSKPYVYCNFTNNLSHRCLKVTLDIGNLI